jgi:S-adenosylmethionine:tRNA ribosyltransferase-isomerase
MWYYSGMTSSVAENHALTDFDFDLPESLIAQKPSPQRDRSRLLYLNRATGRLVHHIFTEIEQHLLPGDLLVVNDTKVFPCRLPASGPGGGRGEIFLLHERGLNHWNVLVKGRGAVGKRLRITDSIEAEITAESVDSVKTVRFHGVNDIRSILAEIGKTPLPPYIKHEADTVDRERYQTVFAVHEGAVAAPTAGLHFTDELLQRLTTKGIDIVAVTLHVGLGTFQPVRVQSITEHRMLPERYSITDTSAKRINNAKAEGRRVIAVGTTSVRTIETAAAGSGRVSPGDGCSELFIFPGYCFTVTDGIITNFHLPKSTLLMLVSAFAGRERTLSSYRTAIAEKYRFYSYGDAMMIL